MKAVLISIKPKWCALIASGDKTIEVRKTKPKLETPFKCYIYCTRGDALAAPCLNVPKYTIHRMNNGTTKGRRMTAEERERSDNSYVNGKVIGEFVCDETITIGNYQEVDYSYMLWVKDRKTTEELCKNACLDEFAIQDYLGANGGFGWHISDLVMYDKPRELGEFSLSRPPQSWCYVERNDGQCV